MKTFSWGCNSHGQLGQGIESEQVNEPSPVSSTFDVSSIVGGGKHTVIVSKNGNIYSCGDNSKGQLSKDRSTKSLLSLELIDFKLKIIKVSCGWDFNLGLSEEGDVFGWGGNSFGQLGQPTENALYYNEPVKIFCDKAIDIGTGLRHSVIISKEGFVFSSGFSRKGQLGIPLSKEKKNVNRFLKVESIKRACKISCGENHSVLSTESGIYSWGDNKFGQLGVDPSRLPVSEIPIQIGCKITDSNIKALVSGWSHNAVLTNEGTVILWGRNDYGQLGERRQENWKPKKVESLTDVAQIVLGSNHGLALKNNGDVLSWGWNEHGNCGNGNCDNLYEPIVLKTIRSKSGLIGAARSDELELGNVQQVAVNYDNITEVPRFDDTMSYTSFYENVLLKNRPVIIKNVTGNWDCVKLWVNNNSLNVDYFEKNYGDVKVPISNCGKRWYNIQEKRMVIMKDYLNYWRGYPKNKDCLYLKDWHFTKDFPNQNVYRVPCYFASDWLNEYYDSNKLLNDDFRFVYIGPKGSWTPFHSDVLTSFSWSANICGRKKWILLPPGAESYFKDELGQVKYDVKLSDDEKVPQMLQIIQEKGEVLFVPSNWYHQVWNVEDAISINHNWINACNILYVWESLKSNLLEVQKEISDCKDGENWKDDCQNLLRASFGFNYYTFYEFLYLTARARITKLRQKEPLILYGNWSFGRNHLIFDLKQILSVLKLFVEDGDFKVLEFSQEMECPRRFLNTLENFLNLEV